MLSRMVQTGPSKQLLLPYAVHQHAVQSVPLACCNPARRMLLPLLLLLLLPPAAATAAGTALGIAQQVAANAAVVI